MAAAGDGAAAANAASSVAPTAVKVDKDLRKGFPPFLVGARRRVSNGSVRNQELENKGQEVHEFRSIDRVSNASGSRIVDVHNG